LGDRVQDLLQRSVFAVESILVDRRGIFLIHDFENPTLLAFDAINFDFNECSIPLYAPREGGWDYDWFDFFCHDWDCKLLNHPSKGPEPKRLAYVGMQADLLHP